MATHEELSLLRDARSGQLNAQVELGKRYLQGSDGLPKNLEAALHWLSCAASQDSLEACILIGRNIPYEIARSSSNPMAICISYERAFDAGETEAGLVFAKLVFNHVDPGTVDPFRQSALAALQSAAHSDSHEAQWMWAEIIAMKDGHRELARIWTERAANGGVTPAQYAMAQYAWDEGDDVVFLEWALPLAKALQQVALTSQRKRCSHPFLPTDRELKLLLRCGQALENRLDASVEDIKHFWAIAAEAGECEAQFSLGLWLARMRADGEPSSATSVSNAEYEEALHWLNLAGEQGMKEAWFVLSRIHERVKFAGTELDLARHYRQKAAELGHRQAQYECGVSAWNFRHLRATNESRAIYWLELANAQGCEAARTMLARIRKSTVCVFEPVPPSENTHENILFTA